MGNIKSQETNQTYIPHMEKEQFYRFFGVRLANEGDGYEEGERNVQIKMDHGTAQMRIDDFPKASPSKFSGNQTIGLQPLPTMELSSCLSNPGTVADLHRHCYDMIPQTFDGFRLSANRNFGTSFAVGYALQMGVRSQLSDFQFNANYVGEQLHQLNGEAYPLLMGEVDAQGNVTGTLMHFIVPRLRGKLMVGITDSEAKNARMVFDYYGDNYTCTCVLSNIDIKQRMGIFVASYLQQLTAYLAVGADLIYQREDIVPGGQVGIVSLIARYQQDNSTWSAMLSMQTLEICYTQIYGESLGASVQLHANILKRQAMAYLCYHCYIPKMEFSFRGGINTRGVITALCEKRLLPLPILLQVCGKINHLSGRFRFGLGLIVG